ncbi:UdgX family uracil-DNA binding protein [Nannocystis bainbridge]|uniref:Type-4 uracil-DNA glycosylase n=1 Tax=Nannocystis bainbridge TaxID=2995303 RepID=A0ABT5E4U2_9BACT|nr:UdgX family uracil-DNA binding protein [Nannocystis bainbridge]MDC0720448.1 UdgX family uracil-DNA binding protein [Nannocystis bainbridge]
MHDDDDEVTGSARDFLPQRLSLPNLRSAARGCHGCPLYRDATQTVFGAGPSGARVMLVGEQPGNDEDIAGEPFVGPAGRVLDEALEQAGIARDDAYVTNVVKHFKWERRGSRRLHKKPGAREVKACLPWLEQEIELIRPEVLVCLGATAAQALLGRAFRVTTMRGRLLADERVPQVLATVHPSSILRQPTADDRRAEMARFVADLAVVAESLQARRGSGRRSSAARG